MIKIIAIPQYQRCHHALLDAGRNQHCPWSMHIQGAYVDSCSTFESVKLQFDILRNLYVATTSQHILQGQLYSFPDIA